MFFRATLIAAAIATATVGWALPTNAQPTVPGAPTAKSASSHSVPGLSFTRRSQKGTP
jgi:hypothetical protein